MRRIQNTRAVRTPPASPSRSPQDFRSRPRAACPPHAANFNQLRYRCANLRLQPRRVAANLAAHALAYFRQSPRNLSSSIPARAAAARKMPMSVLPCTGRPSMRASVLPYLLERGMEREVMHRIAAVQQCSIDIEQVSVRGAPVKTGANKNRSLFDRQLPRHLLLHGLAASGGARCCVRSAGAAASPAPANHPAPISLIVRLNVLRCIPNSRAALH